jgi:adenosine deaminase
MFNTTLTNEYLQIVDTFGFDVDTIERLVLNGVGASLLSPARQEEIEQQFKTEFSQLRNKYNP